jgi:hypothetical protein
MYVNVIQSAKPHKNFSTLYFGGPLTHGAAALRGVQGPSLRYLVPITSNAKYAITQPNIIFNELLQRLKHFGRRQHMWRALGFDTSRS